MKKNLLLLAIFVLTAMVFTSCEFNDSPSTPVLTPYKTTLERTIMIDVVNIGSALNSVYLDLISDSTERAKYAEALLSNTRFLPDDMGYFYVESLSGYCIVDAAVPAIKGLYRMDQTTPNGQYYVRDMINAAHYRGHGWVNYDFKNPVTQKTEKKSGFVSAIPAAEWYVGSGYYASETEGKSGLTENAREDFEYQWFVHTMAQGMAGISAAYAEDPEFISRAYKTMVHHINFDSHGSGYFFVYNLQGVVIAHGATPSLEGKNLIDYQDAKGNFVIQMLIDKVVNEGAGFVDYYWLDPADQQVEGKRAYVEKIEGTDWFVGSGFYHVTD
ncbi:cache domain-containing protein [Mariniphaga sediminis]|uniref:cache domain-containing protein n=1 Tax=Mariniphaga sediminis TaxID=1628158 RepID=UPI003566161A